MSELGDYIFQILEYIARYGLEHFGRFYSSYRGYVRENRDPEDRGRIRVQVPQVSPGVLGNWAYPKMPCGPDSGFFWPPPIDSLVLVEFTCGNPKYPFYTGGWWTTDEGKHQIPKEMRRANKGTEDAPGDAITARGLKTPGGMYLLFDDREGEEKLRLLWQNKDGVKKGFLNFDKNGSMLLQAGNGSSFYLNAEGSEATIFGPAVDGGTSASLSLVPDGVRMIGPEGQLIEIKSGAILVQSELNVTMEVNGAQVKLDAGSVFMVGKDGSHIKMDGAGKIQVMSGGSGSAVVVEGGGVTVLEPSGATISVKGGKVQVNSPAGGILLQSASSVTIPAGIISGDGATDNALKAQSFLAAFDAHVHQFPANPSSPPTGPPVVPLSTMIAALAALKTKVG